MTIEEQLFTRTEFDAFLEDNPEGRYELINGKIVEKVPTEEHGVIASNLHGHLFIYLQKHKNGRLVIEGRHHAPNDESNSRLPDIAFTSNDRALPVVKKGAVPQLPDLAIEIKSPDDTYTGLREKAAYYIANGCRMVWLIYPEKHFVEVYKPDEDLQILMSDDNINGGDVLPGFKLAVKDVFEV